MKRTCLALATAALITLSLPLAKASPKSGEESQAADAKTKLRQIEAISGQIADDADRLSMMAKTTWYDAQSHYDYLEAIRSGINEIGADLRSLDTERDSLASWETEVLDDVVTLFNTVARDEAKALALFNADRNHLWSTSYPDSIAEIYAEAKQAEKRLNAFIKLAGAREQEQRLTHELGSVHGN